MRIIAGRAKGKRLHSPRGRGIRPTADRVKESIFNILGEQWEGIRVLDLFAGTGSLGLEAVSRGAEEVVFIEKSRSALDLLKKNIFLCGFDSNAVVLPMSVPHGLTLMGQRRQFFHLIFADPPYDRGWVERTIGQILIHRVLTEDGLVVIEHGPNESPAQRHGKLAILRQKTYGETTITFLGFKMVDKKRGVADPDGRISLTADP
jgi:16S rRNA (guanine966-N2)-methyltransferase